MIITAKSEVMVTKVTLELDGTTANALFRALELINSGQPIESDYGAALTVKELGEKLRAMYAEASRGNKP